MSTFRKFSLALILLFNLINLGFAQTPPPTQNPSVTTSSNTDSSTPTGASKGVNPGIGTYGGSNFDKVNLFNGNVSMSFPLASLTSRGGMSAGVVLSYNSKLWRVERQEEATGGPKSGTKSITYHPIYDEPDKGLPQLAAGWTIHAGRMHGRQTAIGQSTSCFFDVPPGGRAEPKPRKTLTIFVFTAPDGTEYDFRDSIYDGEPRELVNCQTVNRQKKFVSKDGTFATFINDVDVVDGFFTDQILEPSGYVYLRDGTRFRIDRGRPTEQRDHNGNIVRYSYDGGGRLTQVTDNMGRTITVTYGGQGILATITIKGFNEADRVTVVKRAKLNQQLLNPGQTLAIDQLFPVEAVQLSNQNSPFNPKVVSEVTLPDGHKWEFKYNLYGEVVQVKTPARGLVEYTMGPNPQDGGGYIETANQIFRRVINRRTYPSDSGPIEGKVIYSDPSDSNLRDVDGNVTVTEEEVDPSNSDSVITRTKHKYHSYPTRGLAGASARVQNLNPYRPWLESKELETRQLNPTLNGQDAVMRTSTTIYEQSEAVSWFTVNGQPASQNDPSQPENNSRVKRVISELNDDQPGDTEKVSKVDYDYDQYNNVIFEKLTGYNNEVIRQVERSFITNLNGINYAELNRDIAPPSNPNEFDTHLRSLIAEQTIKDGTGKIESKTTYEYDVYTGQFHSALVARNLTFNGQDPIYGSTNRIHRGNVTAVTAGVVTPDTPATTGTPSTAYSQYDVLGNVVAVVGPLPNQKAETDYSADSQFAFPVQTRQYVSGGLSGQRILTSSREFDFCSGLVKKSVGVNGEETTFEYNDSLDRLTREVRPQSSGISLYPNGFGTTEYAYSSPGVYPNTVYVKTTLDNGRFLESTSEFDGFLRSTKQKRTDPDGEVISETFYDATGRVSKVTNPFRQGEQATTEGYTTTDYDPLDRVLIVKTYDRENSSTGTVTTSYSTNQVTVTDQAGKQRKSLSDAAGRLTTVFEPDEQNNLTLETHYLYDARGNLLQVNQGEQTRTFNYDSMSRLLSATSPESGSAGSATGTTTYQYDKASNLTLRIDPRGINTTYSYDSLNRLATKTYSDSTPSVSYFYDVVPSALPNGVTLPNNGFTFQHTLGRATAIASPSTTREMATALFHTYDIGGRIARSSQLLDSTHYTTDSKYNEASLPTNHTYPSGRTIAHSYNIAGQITDVMSNSQPISQQAKYTATGAILSHQLGNGLYHQMKYNSRLQPTEITLGSGQTGQLAESIWKQEYNYAQYELAQIQNTTSSPTISLNQSQNNGNIGAIKLTPGTAASPINQFFVYDELNRLKLAKEFATTPTPYIIGVGNTPICTPETLLISGTNLANVSEIIFSPSTGVHINSFSIVDNSILAEVFFDGSAVGEHTVKVKAGNLESNEVVVFIGGGGQDPISTSGFGDVVCSNGGGGGGNIADIQPLSDVCKNYQFNPLDLSSAMGEANFTFDLTCPGLSDATLYTTWGCTVNPVFGLGASNAHALFEILINGTPLYSKDLVVSYGPNTEVVSSTGYCDQGNCVSGNEPLDGGGVIPLNDYLGQVITVTYRFSGDATFDSLGKRPQFSGGVTAFVSYEIPTPFAPANGKSTALPAKSHIYKITVLAVKPAKVDSSSSNFSPIEPSPLVDIDSASWSQLYSYDRYGNRTQVQGTNEQTLLISTSKNRITSPGYVYDDAGNLISNPDGKFFFYDAENRLLKVATDQAGSNVIAQYFYDANGWRVKKVVTSGTSTRFVYDHAGRLLAEYEGEPVPSITAPTKENIYGPSGMLATVEPDKINYHTPDHLGSPRVLTDAFGAVISRRDNFPFGESMPDSIGNRASIFGYSVSDTVKQRFTTYFKDEEAGLDFAQARHFNGALGRFMQPDEFNDGPVEVFALVASSNPNFYADITNPQSLNKYHYCYNNPLKYNDPSGHYGDGETLKQTLLAGAAAVEYFVTGATIGTASVGIILGYGTTKAFVETPSHLRQSRRFVDENGVFESNANAQILLNKGKDDTKDTNKAAQASSNQPQANASAGGSSSNKNNKQDDDDDDDDDDQKYAKYYNKGERGGKENEQRRKPGSLGQRKSTDALRQENEGPNSIAKKIGLTKSQRDQFHNAISGQGYTYQQMIDIAKEIKGSK